MADVSVIFNADTGQYIANVQSMDKATIKSAQTVAEAKNLILASNKAKLDSAVKSGASQQELDRINLKSARDITNVTESNAKKTITYQKELIESTKRTAAELANLPKVVAKVDEEHAAFTKQMAASAAIRALEGNSGIRAAERALTMVPGLGEGLQTIAPALGWLGLAAAMGGVVEKGIELAREWDAVAQAEKRAADGAQAVIDRMDKAADDSADTARKLLEVTQGKVGGARFDVEHLKLTVDSDDVTKIRQAQEEVDKLNARIKKGRDAIVPGGGVRMYGQADVDDAEAAKKLLPNAQGNLAAAQIERQTDQQKLLLAQNDLQDAVKDKAKEALDESQKAAAARLKAMDSELAEWKVNASVTLKAEYEFWNARRLVFAAGSQQYNEVIEKQARLAEEGAHKAHEAVERIRRSQEENAKDPGRDQVVRSLMRFDEERARGAREAQRASDNSSDSANELTAIRARNAAALEELRINEAVGKTITRQDAAVQLAAVHTKAYGDEIDRLNAKARQIAKAGYLTVAEKQAALGRLSIDADNVQSQRAAQITRDAHAMAAPDTSAMVGAKDALNELADAARDGAGQMREFIGSSLQSVNAAIIKGGGFKEAFSGIARNAESTLLSKAEGTVLQGLGFGNQAPKGTAGDPLHVVMTGLQMPGLTNSLPSGSEGLGGGFWGTLLNFLPGRAEGGGVSAGMAYMVGERGPEPFFPGVSGTIGTNKAMNAAFGGGGGGGHTFNIDASGSHDPAATQAAVMRGIKAAAPHIIAASVQAGRADNTRRAPSTRQ